MGCGTTKTRQALKSRELDEKGFEVVCLRTHSHLDILANRTISKTAGIERSLIQMVNQKTRSLDRERDAASVIVSNIWMIDAIEIVKRCCTILKEKSSYICSLEGNQLRLGDLMICIETIVWAGKRINLKDLQNLQSILEEFFINHGEPLMKNDSRVNPKLKECFQSVMPNKDQINSYLGLLSQKEGVHIDFFNQIGHGISLNYANSAPFVKTF